MEIYDYILSLEKRAAAAVSDMSCASLETRNAVLTTLSKKLVENSEKILAANRIDLDRAAENSVPKTMLDRLALSEARIKAMADSLTELVALPDALAGEKTWKRDSGIEICEKKVPLGVCAIIFEARPNVTLDAAALCINHLTLLVHNLIVF